MGVPVTILTPEDIYDHVINWNNDERVSMLPLWFLNPNEQKPQALNRQCTSDFKIEVVATAIREHLGVKRLNRHEIRIWQGITTDEIKRAERSPLFTNGFRVNHYPFIGKYANITYPDFNWKDYTRGKIIEDIFKKFGFKIPPKSSCFFCPFHDIEYWYHIFLNFKNEWKLACILDDKIRNYNFRDTFESGPFYLYNGLIPLREIDFDFEIAKKKKSTLISGCQSGFCFV